MVRLPIKEGGQEPLSTGNDTTGLLIYMYIIHVLYGQKYSNFGLNSQSIRIDGLLRDLNNYKIPKTPNFNFLANFLAARYIHRLSLGSLWAPVAPH